MSIDKSENKNIQSPTLERQITYQKWQLAKHILDIQPQSKCIPQSIKVETVFSASGLITSFVLVRCCTGEFLMCVCVTAPDKVISCVCRTVDFD